MSDVKVEIDLYPPDAGVMSTRKIGLGLENVILLEAREDDEATTGLAFRYTGSLLNSAEELRELIAHFLTVLDAGLEQNDVE